MKQKTPVMATITIAVQIMIKFYCHYKLHLTVLARELRWPHLSGEEELRKKREVGKIQDC